MRTFLSTWNGVYVFPPQARTTRSFASNTLGNLGCGAWCGTDWLQFQWPQQAKEHHITFLELVAVLLACVVWGPGWWGQWILCWCDDQVAIQAIAARSCHDPGLMHLLLCLFFLEATFQFELIAEHIPGVHNTLADDLSRYSLPAFPSRVLQASRMPTAITPQLPLVLLDPTLDWTSPTWTQLFSGTVTRAQQS